MPAMGQVWYVIQQGNYPFSGDLKNAYLHIPIVKHHHHFFMVYLAMQTFYIGRFCHSACCSH